MHLIFITIEWRMELRLRLHEAPCVCVMEHGLERIWGDSPESSHGKQRLCAGEGLVERKAAYRGNTKDT